MGGERKGSLKDRSELEFSYRRKKLLNLALFDTQLRSKNKVERNDAEVDFCLRYILLKKDHERRVNEIESRIEESTCSAKRDFTTYFDDAEPSFLLSLSSLFLEQHFPRRFSLVVFVLRYTDVYSLTSSVFPTSVFDAHSILWTETASRSLYSPCIRRHDMQN